jgi:uncharacterized RDD family membrane protein YckC
MNRARQRSTRQHAGLGLLGRRIAAYLADILLLFAILAPAGQFMIWLLGATPPHNGPEIERVILWNFSLPAWLYCIAGDRSSATVGKRLLKIQVRTVRGERLSLGRALVRTAVKLLPWELAHVSAFALSTDLSQFRPVQIIGVAAANLLSVVYLGVAAATTGQRSVHDYAAGTLVGLVTADTEASKGGK